MGVSMRDAANVLRAISSFKMRDGTNVLRTIQSIKMRDAANVLRTIYTAMTANASPSDVSGTVGTFGPGAATVTSNSTTASPSGGTAPYSYAWAYSSGDTGITPFAPTSASTTFSKSLGLGVENIASFVCTITDANGATAQTFVSVTLNHVDLN